METSEEFYTYDLTALRKYANGDPINFVDPWGRDKGGLTVTTTQTGNQKQTQITLNVVVLPPSQEAPQWMQTRKFLDGSAKEIKASIEQNWTGQSANQSWSTTVNVRVGSDPNDVKDGEHSIAFMKSTGAVCWLLRVWREVHVDPTKYDWHNRFTRVWS